MARIGPARFDSGWRGAVRRGRSGAVRQGATRRDSDGPDEPRHDMTNEREPEAPPTHWVRYDEPSATSKRLQLTVCGRWVPPREVAHGGDELTCLDCARWVDEFESLEVGP